VTRRFWGTGVLIAALLGIPAPAAAFERDFHYYVVYIVLRAKGYRQIAANRLAGFSQYVDDNPATEPIAVSEDTRMRFHFAGSDPTHPTTRNQVSARTLVVDSFQRYLRDEPDGVYVAGQSLHLLADTFAHETFTAWPSYEVNCRRWFSIAQFCVGHADTPEWGHAPDRPYNDVDRAMEAAKTIHDTVEPGGGTETAWSAIEADLRRALTAAGGSADRSLEIRERNVRDVAKRWFEDTPYDKAAFATHAAEFNRAVGAVLKSWKRAASWRPGWW
jgi:hypothetical protein